MYSCLVGTPFSDSSDEILQVFGSVMLNEEVSEEVVVGVLQSEEELSDSDGDVVSVVVPVLVSDEVSPEVLPSVVVVVFGHTELSYTVIPIACIS